MRMSVAWAWALACLGLAPAAAGQATFSSAVSTVATYVTVVGDGGGIATGLSAKDFEIREDGQVRAITQFQAGALPITMVAMLDDSPSMQSSHPATHAAATALVHGLKSGDRALIGVFSRTVRLNGNFTGNQAELLEQAGESLPPMAGTALWDGVNAGVTAIQEEPGRRVVLVLTDGDDNSSQADAGAVAALAARENVMIYGVGIRGAEQRLSKGLKDLALESGGWFFELKSGDNLAATFQRVVEELRNQYLLGFTPALLDGNAHRLEVRVKRRGLTARARRSYVASRPGTPHVDVR